MDAAIRAEGLSKRFGDLEALAPLRLEVGRARPRAGLWPGGPAVARRRGGRADLDPVPPRSFGLIFAPGQPDQSEVKHGQRGQATEKCTAVIR